ncbi:hemerythrin family protein [bacterium]|nr:hemerythrin family protein [bacterium]
MATGIPWIDTQHKNIIIRANEFLDAVSQSKGKKEIEKAIKILDEFANTHFETENKYMLQYKYPDYKLHKAQHEKYINVIDSLKIEYDIQILSPDFEKKIKIVLLSYLRDHIEKFDKPLADFLRQSKR